MSHSKDSESRGDDGLGPIEQGAVTELSDLQAVWSRDHPPESLEIESQLRRWRRRHRLVQALEGGLLLALVLATVQAFGRGAGVAEAWLWGNAWLLAVSVAGFALWNRRGLGRAVAESTPEFLRLWRLRCRRGLLTVRFVRLVVLAQAIFYLWYWRSIGLTGGAAIVASSLLVAYVIWSVFYRRFCLARLSRIDELEEG